MGGLDFDINVNVVVIEGKNISVQLYNVKNSMMRLFYRADELDSFKTNHIKGIAKMMLDQKIKKIDSLKYYHYSDIKKYLD